MSLKDRVSRPISSARRGSGRVWSKRPEAMVSACVASRRNGSSSRDTTRVQTSSISSRPTSTITAIMPRKRL